MNDVRIFVTGVGGGGGGEQILKALRLSLLNYYIVGGDITPYSKGLYMVDKAYILPPALSSDYLDVLLNICTKENIQALFTGSEPELKIVSKNRCLFENIGVKLFINPESVIDICLDKFQTMNWFKDNGFSFPKTITVNCFDDLELVDFFPVVLKPSVGGGGSTNTFIAQDRKELDLFASYLLHIYSQFIIQEYVGNANGEYTVGVLSDMEGNLINSIAVKKNILGGLSNRLKVKSKFNDELLVISNGISQGEIGKFPIVTQQCELVAQKLGSTSAINIQCRLVDDKCYIFEINPRFSGTTSLRAMVGYNEPDVLVRKYILGEHITPNFPYKEGYISRGLDELFITPSMADKVNRM